MKKVLPILGFLAIGSSAIAQLPVSTSPSNKNVVLEEFTGIHCTYCPDGHKRAQQISDQNPGRVVLINVHVGSYAVPNAGEPDFRTSFGSAIGGQTGLTGYPAGTVNRRNFPGSEMGNAGTTGMGRGDWAPNAPTIIGEASYANIALEGTLDASTRELTVDVEMYFTGTTAPANVNLNVALLQSNVEGPQTGMNANPSQILPNGNYLHSHILRHLLTGQWGDIITTTTQGTTVTRQYTYTLPADINGVDLVLGDLDIVAFVAEGQQNVITGDHGPISYTGLVSNNGSAQELVAPASTCKSTIDASFTLKNKGQADLTSAVIEYGFAGQATQTYNWTGNLATFASEDVNLTGIAVPTNGGNINIDVTSVNGGTDDDATDNTTTAPMTIATDNGQGTDYELTVTQDRYGSETTWTLKDENGATISSGGPYANLSANGVLDHVVNVTLSSTGCYDFEIVDSYGDGINGGYGAGGFEMLTTTGAVVFNSNGNFGSGEVKPHTITSLAVGIETIGINEFIVYPNPTSDFTTIEFESLNDNNTEMFITNTLGAVVNNNFTINKGFNKINVDCTDLPTGMYFITLSNNGQNVVKKFNVIK